MATTVRRVTRRSTALREHLIAGRYRPAFTFSDDWCDVSQQSRNARAPSPRLSAERERELVVAAERGDRAACRELVAAFLPAIVHVAHRFETGRQVQRAEL